MNKFEELLTHKTLPKLGGLCGEIKTASEKEKKVWNLIDINQPWYWGYSGDRDRIYYATSYLDKIRKITPLRQTILMLANEIYKDTYDKKRKKKSLFKST